MTIEQIFAVKPSELASVGIATPAVPILKTRINYSLTDYLNEKTLTKRGLDIMNREFGSTAGMTVALRGEAGEGETLETQIYDYVDYDEESEEKQEPVTLRTCYTVDGLKNLSVESLQPWDTVRLTAESTADIQGKIDGVIWMEEDGAGPRGKSRVQPEKKRFCGSEGTQFQ